MKLTRKYWVSVYLVTALIILNFGNAFGANILFLFGGANISHKISIWPFAKALAEKGHNVTFVSSAAEQRSPNNFGITDIAPTIFEEFTKLKYKSDRIQDRKDGVKWDLHSFGYDYGSIEFCRVMLKTYKEDQVFNNVIENGNFDLVFINSVFGECSAYFVHRMGAKYILFSSMTILPWFHGVYGAPVEASSIPDLLAEAAHPPGFLDRMWNVYRHSLKYDRHLIHGEVIQKMCQETFGLTSTPSLLELDRNASLVFVNSHYSVDFARSLPPLFVNVGGMQCWEELGELPPNFKEFMDGAEEGVVLITYGSTVDIASLDRFYLNIYFNMMRKFDKVRFIWRWVGPMPEGHPVNVMAAKWLPQREILDHPKTLAFMTHGGYNSINEATCHGIPLIVFPLFVDQDYNAMRVRVQGLGLSVEITELSQSSLDSAVGEIVYNKKYKKNMEARSRIFKDRRLSPVEEAVYYTEFVLRQDDTSALKPMLLEQPWIVRTSIDAYLGFLALFTIPPLFLMYIISRIVKCFWGK